MTRKKMRMRRKSLRLLPLRLRRRPRRYVSCFPLVI